MFVEATAAAARAVAAGSTHAIRQRNAMLDLELITRLRSGPGAAWSLRGSPGVDDEQLPGAVRHGLTKISIGTLLKARPSATVPWACGSCRGARHLPAHLDGRPGELCWPQNTISAWLCVALCGWTLAPGMAPIDRSRCSN